MIKTDHMFCCAFCLNNNILSIYSISIFRIFLLVDINFSFIFKIIDFLCTSFLKYKHTCSLLEFDLFYSVHSCIGIAVFSLCIILMFNICVMPKHAYILFFSGVLFPVLYRNSQNAKFCHALWGAFM